ncbi:MAG: adenylate/guanylate cyclase domain-containing protein [Bacteroidota bacterium]
MRRGIKDYLKNLGQSVAFWTVTSASFVIFRFYGLDQEVGVAVLPGFENGQTFFQPMIVFTAIGFSLGLLYATIDYLFDRYVSRRMALFANLIFRSLVYFLVTTALLTASVGVFSRIFELDMDIEQGLWWLSDKRFWAFMYYIILSSFLFSFIKIAVERFGKGVFLRILMGKYKNPREEDRIFMFLDLKDSTTIAEKIGHFKYSQFIQDCFYDLNEVVPKFEAEIYQYVGDEAVLSWPYEKGLANNNCVGLFFAFERQKRSRKNYYIDKYGVFPEFKAGMHGGRLMAAEVGSVKKELAYHGDVINTSARIQGECNKHNVSLLVSGKLLKDLDLKIEKYSTSKSLGDILLKGKQKKVRIHTLTLADAVAG